ncbi:MAG: GNAT family N-acetyltransferase [Clostridia bacterium]|nr:GNAT family N-acetyltransferase [Clostridia bacterium]
MVEVIRDPDEKEAITRKILTALTDWFEIPEAVEEFIRTSRGQLFLAAKEGGEAVGFLTLSETGKATVELHVMGVLKEYHRQGIGRALVENAKALAAAEGYSFFQVKTVQYGMYPEYDQTNRFYQACGFKEFEVIPQLWGKDNPCQIYVMSL